MKKKHLAGKVQQGWISGGTKFPPLMAIRCPNCGKDMGRSQKRACSAECFHAMNAKQAAA